MTARTILTLTSVVSLGLITGLWYGWVVSVIPGLRVVDHRTYIETMQRINVEIVNPGFIFGFVFTPVLLVAAAVVEHRAGNTRRAWTLGVAAATYVVGVLGVTAGGNIPLNNALDAFSLDRASAVEIAERRRSYETPWNRWHFVRTFASVAAFVVATAALFSDID